MKAFLLTALVAGTALGNVDILIPGSGQVPVVGWTHNSTSHLMHCQEPHEPVDLGGACQDVFLSLHDGSESDPVLLAVSGSRNGWNYSTCLSVLALPGLTVATSRELFADDFYPPVYCSWYVLPILPRYVFSQEDRRLFLAMNTGYTDDAVQDETWMTTVSVDPWSSSIVASTDTTSWRQSVFTAAFSLSGQIPQGGLPAFTTASGSWDGYPGPSYFGITSVCLESDTLHENTLYGIFAGSYPPVPPEVLATGYGQTGQLSLWTDTAGVVWCSSFVGSPASPENSTVEMPHSEMPFAAALTRTRNDSGILSAWYDGSFIMVRHWQDGWNDYAHAVEPWTNVSAGNIAVCSDTDGYWVAWKGDQDTLPQYRFIPRNSVTGIDDTNAGSGTDVELAVSGNPVGFGSTCSVSLPCHQHYSLRLFDLYGRNLGEIASGEGSSVNVPLDLSAYPSGVYHVVLSADHGVSSVRVVKTGY